jgi:ribosomal protein S18 acetylase RimI-like enzyme
MALTLRASLLGLRDRERALERLRGSAAHDLLLTELVASLGRAARRGEATPEIVALWRGRELASLAAVRPTVVLARDLPEAGLDLVIPYLERLQTGLLKSGRPLADELWTRLERRGRRAIVDRTETAYRLELGEGTPPPCTKHPVRLAEASDLEDLVYAARASLREEERPDPFDGDPSGFRRWVLSRVPRARVVDVDGRPRFVAYADVRRPDGWLVQGVYTWPEARRTGLARSGMERLIAEAREAGSSHIQLAVVDGNAPAVALYEGLGFEAFDSLRTVLFV